MVFNRAKYLERIGVNAASLSPTVETLRLLQRSHLLAVPFENLDIHWHRPIVLDVDRFYSKVVGEGRGGFCYELNGLFNELLAAFGFSTRLISAGVFGADGVLGPEFDHAAIITTIDEDEFLVDVGFGDFTAEPLRFVVGETQYDRNGLFRIEKTEDSGFLVSKLTADRWKDQYIFKDTARELSEFAEMCDFQQYSPESTFTKRRVCSILTDGGRKTLSDKAFIVTVGDERVEEPIADEREFYRCLEREFGILRPSP
ncbi:MAG: arylamine N-acetyltransferase [Pyrinomonadaceae bacterium]|nr:arylamine N-acetyltransferase [Pyrinomonadaceae bacterium]